MVEVFSIVHVNDELGWPEALEADLEGRIQIMKEESEIKMCM